MIIENNVKEHKAISLSFSSNSKKTSIKHNERTLEDKGILADKGNHINWNKTSKNRILVSEPIKDAYESLFGDAVKAYNSKQKRKDRRIDDYYSKVFHDGSLDTQKEFIIQAGEKDDGISDDIKAASLEDYLNRFMEEYPQLHVYSAVIHMDEATPHLHMCVIPVAEGYKRGMSKRPSFSKATGIKSVDDFRRFAEDNRHLLLDAINGEMTKAHKDIVFTRKEVGTHTYVEPQQYREMMAEADKKLVNAEDQADEIINDAKNQADEILKTAEKKAAGNLENLKKSAIDRVNSEVKAYSDEQRSKVDKEISQKRQESIKLNDDLSRVHKEIELKNTEYKAVSNDFDILQIKYDNLQKQNADFEQRLYDVSQKEQKNKRKEKELEEKESERQQREKELNDRESEIKADESHLQQFKDDILERLQNALQSFLDALKEKSEKEIMDAKKQAESLQEKTQSDDYEGVMFNAQQFLESLNSLHPKEQQQGRSL